MYRFITGGVASDERGQIKFVNEFDMSVIKRFYIIKNNDLNLIRGWRAHRIEQRWFYVLSGSFSIDLVKIDNWENPNEYLDVNREVVHSGNYDILHVPAGYATAIRALEIESEILVFADHHLSHAVFDDHTFELTYFKKQLD